MATVRLFASARVAAGTGRDTIEGGTVEGILRVACERYGGDFAGLLETCNIWVNGEPAGPDHRVTDADEVAILPPVSGG
jgi:molybdopterin synthase sulfur carrier subunit